MTIFQSFFWLGCSAFGGPPAHLALFHQRFVQQLKWVSDAQYQYWMTCASILPGPSSSQVGIAIGYHRGGAFGALMAWFGFTLPMASILILAGLAMGSHSTDWLGGIAQTATWAVLGLVGQVIGSMAKQQVRHPLQWGLMALALISSWIWPSAMLAVVLIGTGALVGLAWHRMSIRLPALGLNPWMMFFVMASALALALPESLIAAAWRVGALVIGGGHVALPLIAYEPALMTGIRIEDFWSGYALTQSLPGPMFGFMGYIVALSTQSIGLSALALLCVFLPGAALMIAVVRAQMGPTPRLQAALWGACAVVIGLLAASTLPGLSTSLGQGWLAWLAIPLALWWCQRGGSAPLLIASYAAFGFLRHSLALGI